MQPFVFLREPLRLPSLNDFDSDLRADVEHLNAMAARFIAAVNERHHEESQRLVADIDWSVHTLALRHRLSDHWLRRRRLGVGREPRSQMPEILNYSQSKGLMIEALGQASADEFLAACKRLCGGCFGYGIENFRVAAIGIDADADGTRVEFGDWRFVPDRLRQLFLDVRASDLPFAMKAIGILAVFLNIHPFADGNGRCARSWFNAVLARHTASSAVYVPLRAAFDASDGGFEIRLREAEINGDWRALVRYFYNVFEIALAGLVRGRLKAHQQYRDAR